MQQKYQELLALYQQLLTSWKELVGKIGELCNVAHARVNWDLRTEIHTESHEPTTLDSYAQTYASDTVAQPYSITLNQGQAYFNDIARQANVTLDQGLTDEWERFLRECGLEQDLEKLDLEETDDQAHVDSTGAC